MQNLVPVQVTRGIPLRSYLTQEDFVFKLMLIFTPLVSFMGLVVSVVVHTPSTTLSVKIHHPLLTNCKRIMHVFGMYNIWWKLIF